MTAFALASVLALLSGLHVYWVLGGRWGWGAAIPAPAPVWLSQSSAGILSLIFFLHAVGNFRLIGFFKSVRGTPFAIWDTRLFSPLCLLLSAGFARVATL